MDQFLCMAFAQLTYRESLRDIEVCLRGNQSKLYHMGIRSRISRSTLADANENRDWRIYADFAQILISIAKDLYARDDFGINLQAEVYALDRSLYTILQFLSVSIFERTPVSEAFSQQFYKTKMSDYHNQLLLFNL